jgi:hypothetical protein
VHMGRSAAADFTDRSRFDSGDLVQDGKRRSLLDSECRVVARVIRSADVRKRDGGELISCPVSELIGVCALGRRGAWRDRPGTPVHQLFVESAWLGSQARLLGRRTCLRFGDLHLAAGPRPREPIYVLAASPVSAGTGRVLPQAAQLA